jgi:hypothetical protein
MNTNNINNDRLLKDMLKKSGVEEPSPGFTTNLMQMVSSISPHAASAYKPLISKKAWAMMFIACIGVLIATLLLPGKPSAVPKPVTAFYDIVNQHIMFPLHNGIKILENAAPGLEIVAFSALSVLMLLALDYFVRKKLKMR